MEQRLRSFSTDTTMEAHLDRFRRSLDSYPIGTCPLSMEMTMLHNAKTQSCGKCVPCRDGFVQLEKMLGSLLSGQGDAGDRERTREEMTDLATLVRDTSDCAIGYQNAELVLDGMERFAAELDSHIHESRCLEDRQQKIPCVSLCPAHVDVPGYIALIGAGENAAAVNLIRENNPLPSACALICEHPCESHCRRALIDDDVNIRGLKEYAVDHAPAHELPVPERGPDTGHRVAVVGGGPSGLSAAWFLALMGHQVVLFDRNEKLGGMLRYGIPNYRFPKDRLDSDVAGVLAVGNIEVRTLVDVGTDVTLTELRDAYDAVFLGVGAQLGLGIDVPGSEADDVVSAVAMLHELALGNRPDYTGKRVVVIGGGNVAMDATRTAIRCGAADVEVVYRRRREDMTALPAEIQGAVEEGAKLSVLTAPHHIETDELGRVVAVWGQPQMPGAYDAAGRPRPVPADKPLRAIPADVVLVAVGQAIETEHLSDAGLPVQRRRLLADDTGVVIDVPGAYGGGDCVTGPSTVIEAIAAGKVAAFHIDTFLGHHHKVSFGIEVPAAGPNHRTPTGRVEAEERPAEERGRDFEYVMLPMTDQEAAQEVSRCLRCDHYGCGTLVGGRP